MKTMMRFLLGCAALLAVATTAQAQVEIKAGGGMLFDPARWGGHVSVEVPIGDTYPTYLAPFVEFHRKNSINEIPMGASLHYKAPFSDRYGTVYFGIGGGLFLARGPSNISATEPMVTADGGLQFDFSETVSVFTQVRWFRAFASGSKNEVSLQAGLSFKVGAE